MYICVCLYICLYYIYHTHGALIPHLLSCTWSQLQAYHFASHRDVGWYMPDKLHHPRRPRPELADELHILHVWDADPISNTLPNAPNTCPKPAKFHRSHRPEQYVTCA